MRVNGLTARPDGMQKAEREKMKPLGEDSEGKKQSKRENPAMTETGTTARGGEQGSQLTGFTTPRSEAADWDSTMYNTRRWQADLYLVVSQDSC